MPILVIFDHEILRVRCESSYLKVNNTFKNNLKENEKGLPEKMFYSDLLSFLSSDLRGDMFKGFVCRSSVVMDLFNNFVRFSR